MKMDNRCVFTPPGGMQRPPLRVLCVAPVNTYLNLFSQNRFAAFHAICPFLNSKRGFPYHAGR